MKRQHAGRLERERRLIDTRSSGPDWHLSPDGHFFARGSVPGERETSAWASEFKVARITHRGKPRPPFDVVTVQSLLYTSLTISLSAAFLAMLGKQWATLRSHGGSAADRSRDKQRKMDEFEKLHFHFAIDSLPLMLRFALLLLGYALSGYL